MSVSVHNPYSGKDDETCSVSFEAQQKLKQTGVSGQQTEAEFNKSKLLGEWGVIKAKALKGEIPKGTKVLTFTTGNSRGYLYADPSSQTGLKKKTFLDDKTFDTDLLHPKDADYWISSGKFNTAIPQSVKPKPDPEPAMFDIVVADEIQVKAEDGKLKDLQVVALHPNGDKVVFLGPNDFMHMEKKDTGGFQPGAIDSDLITVLGSEPDLVQQWQQVASDGNVRMVKAPDKVKEVTGPSSEILDTLTPAQKQTYEVILKEGPIPGGFQFKGVYLNSLPALHKKGLIKSTKTGPFSSEISAIPVKDLSPKDDGQVAAPTPSTPVNSGSASVGSMSNEDVAAMFVKVKDDLAKEKGLNIKGANVELDLLVYKAIGEKTGYQAFEVKGKIDAYKADGNKLSALKKKVLNGSKKVPDPKPNDVPTKATSTTANAVKEEIKNTVADEPKKLYSDEDIAAQYIIAKDKIVAGSNGKWTLYSKSDELDLEIAIQVGLKTGFNPLQQKQALANYLGSGKKLSTLKKQLAKQGAFTPQADTLKKSGSDKTQADKAKDVNDKADAGYTPTPEPTTGTPPTDTGKAAPKRVQSEAQQSGDISGFSDVLKADVYKEFKAFGGKAYLTSSEGQVYEAIAGVQLELKNFNKDLSLLQILRIIDEQGAKKFGVENTKPFEKKVATWLTSPAGTDHIKKAQILIAEQAKKKAEKAEAEKAAKLLEANQPALPADSAQFEDWSLDKARRVSGTWLAEKPWTAQQKADLKHYTGSAYTEMNGLLRGNRSNIDERSRKAIEGAKAGMRPTTEPILVKRGTGLSQFGFDHGDDALMWGITGKTFQDKGFLSTSAGGRAAFSGKVRMEVECPVGTPMAYVAPISRYPSENEMLLQAGLNYKVLNVRLENGTYIVRLRVVL